MEYATKRAEAKRRSSGAYDVLREETEEESDDAEDSEESEDEEVQEQSECPEEEEEDIEVEQEDEGKGEEADDEGADEDDRRQEEYLRTYAETSADNESREKILEILAEARALLDEDPTSRKEQKESKEKSSGSTRGMDVVLRDSGRTVTQWPQCWCIDPSSSWRLERSPWRGTSSPSTSSLVEAEDEESAKGIEQQKKEIDNKLKVMKEYAWEQDKQTREAPLALLTKETMLSQDWHNARYHRAIAAGVSHSEAWRKEKGRRRAHLHRQLGMKERAQERRRFDALWIEKFQNRVRTAKDYIVDDTENLVAEGIETEVVHPTEEGMQVLRGGRKSKGHKEQLMFRGFQGRDFREFTRETQEDEKEVMERKRVNIFTKGSKKRTPAKKKKKKRNEKRKLRRRKQEACRALAWEGQCNRDPCPFSHDEKKIEELKTTHCGYFLHGTCRYGDWCRLVQQEEEKELVRME